VHSLSIYSAIEFANKAHRGQDRKLDGDPFIVHPLAVAGLLADYYSDKSLIIAAILHDVAEDTPVTFDQLRKKFGEEITQIVMDVSQTDKKLPWKERKDRYFKHLTTKASINAIRVSAADKYHNLQDIVSWWQQLGDEIFTHFNASKEEILANYRRLIEFFEKKKIPWVNQLWDLLRAIT